MHLFIATGFLLIKLQAHGPTWERALPWTTEIETAQQLQHSNYSNKQAVPGMFLTSDPDFLVAHHLLVQSFMFFRAYCQVCRKAINTLAMSQTPSVAPTCMTFSFHTGCTAATCGACEQWNHPSSGHQGMR